MKAVVIKKHGGLDALEYEDVADPTPGPNEVVMRVFAAGLNHVDIDVRNGISGVESIQSLPHVPGVDCTGVVESVGSNVTLWKVGDRVTPHFILTCGKCANCRAGKENICTDSKILGLTHWGGYAEKIVVGENHLVRIPDSVSFDDAAAGMNPLATAWEAIIITAKLTAGETIMITGAGGGVGSHAVQVAALAGARVIASVGAADKMDKIRALGADEVINYKAESLVDGVLRVTDGRGVDVVFDGIGGQILKDSIKSLAPGGRVASIGAHGGEIVDIDMIEFFRKHITMHGCGRSSREIFALVLDLIGRGKLKPVLHKAYPLEQAAEAMKVMESRNFFGRIILNPPQSS
jgi:NADPH:quinone reductase-like Zn-dependent oxidoreductase